MRALRQSGKHWHRGLTGAPHPTHRARPQWRSMQSFIRIVTGYARRAQISPGRCANCWCTSAALTLGHLGDRMRPGRYSHRGLPPHEFAPMRGAHPSFERTRHGSRFRPSFHSRPYAPCFHARLNSFVKRHRHGSREGLDIHGPPKDTDSTVEIPRFEM